jgi:hypothetical protein
MMGVTMLGASLSLSTVLVPSRPLAYVNQHKARLPNESYHSQPKSEQDG